ncbi:MAG: C39 family peptidase [Nocardioides sp.]
MTGHVSFRAWRAGELDRSVHLGTVAGPAGLSLEEPVGLRTCVDPHADEPSRRTYEWAAWLSPAVTPGHPFTTLVPSWNARTPEDSWVEVEVRTSPDGVHWSRWFSMGCWAELDDEIHPTTVADPGDPDASVSADELSARGSTAWTSYQLRVGLMRRPGSKAVPTVSLVGAVVSMPGPAAAPGSASAGPARGVELPVPAYSQQLHRGQDPHLNHGGESWCSPTATSMVLGTWGLGPSPDELAWVDPSFDDPVVNHAARYVFDYAYNGAGNWSFNTAYAARYGTEAFVTRLRSLDEAELFVAAGIPLVASVSFTCDELDGAGYGTAGHLLTVVGFDDAGDVICNDPASHEVPSNDEVRVVYDRAQFERVWQRGSDGLVYVIHPVDVPLPPPLRPAEPNW